MQKYDPVGARFIELSRYANMEVSPESQGKPFPEYLSRVIDETQIIPLPDPARINLGSSDLRSVIENRRSVRRYDQEAFLSLDELSYLLWLTQGVKKVSEKTGLTLRTVPSAGARHPFETYLAINRVESLVPGIYHFVAHLHALEAFQQGNDIIDKLNEAAQNQSQVITSAVTFIWTAIPYRTSWRYGSRGYRYLYLDAGHVCQNLHLAAESIGYGVCAIGAFNDEKVDALLGFDGKEQFSIYLASCGKKATSNNLPKS
ncbi:MAG: SagB/ThcOx family dehydrogenase [Anaerolineaceae bacterium]